jgi:hypothetical protein
MLLFLSYAGEDGDIAREIADRLRSEHVSVYAPRDRTVPPGTTAADPERAIQQADAFVALLSPDSLTSASCSREREVALRREWPSAAHRAGTDFVRVLQIRDTPYHPAGPLRSQPWFDLTGRAATKRVISDLASLFASGPDQGPSGNAAASDDDGGKPPPPPPDFANREREREEVKDGVTGQDGERFWLLLASPQHGKSWLLRQIAEDVPRNRGNWWKVSWVDVRELAPEIAGDADAILRMMLRQPQDGAGPVDIRGAVDGIIDKGPYFLCLLDSAELLDDRTVYRLRQHLDAISKEIGQRHANARLAVIVASRRDRAWIGLEPARPPRIKRLSEFSVDVVTDALAKLARRSGRGVTSDLYQHAERIHRQSEGLPRLLTGCLDWTAGHWGELHLLDDRDTFHEIARPYVEDVLLSPDSLRGSGPMWTGEQQRAMWHAFRVLSVFRLFTGSHLSGPADRGELRDARIRAGWSADDLWNAVIGADLLYRVEKGAPMTIDRPIGRLLFRYLYPSEAERGQATTQACEFLQPFTLELSGSLAADMLIECLWHQAQAFILTGPSAGLEASLTRLADHLSTRMKPDGAFTADYLRGYAAECMSNDLELWGALRDVPGLLDRVAAVLHPEPEHP